LQDRLLTAGSALYAYTGDGALATKLDAAGTIDFRYDMACNLLGATMPGGHSLGYVLDPAGRRIGRIKDGAFTHRWIYSGNVGPAAEVAEDGTLVTRFVYGARSWVPVYMVRSGTTYALVTDAEASVRLVVDIATGVVAQRLDYDEFGRIISDTNPGFQPFGFAGGIYDPDTGLVRLGARDYHPSVGRRATH